MVTLFFFISYMLVVVHMSMDKDRYICDSWHCPLSILCSVAAACGAAFVGLPIDFGVIYPSVDWNVVHALSCGLLVCALVNWFVLFAAWRYRVTGQMTLFEKMSEPLSSAGTYPCHHGM